MATARSLRSILLLTLFASASAHGQTALPKDSPFMPAPGTLAAAAPANETLELTGYSGTGKTTVVCVTDMQAKRSYWIPIGSTTEGIKVLSFNAAQDQTTITVGGLQKTLRMRHAVVTAADNANPGAAAASFAAAPAATPVTQGVPQPPPAPGSVIQQETEARMLVSDLLEIGIQQRKAYEEAQKKADLERAAAKKP
jgi:hypothetical protein